MARCPECGEALPADAPGGICPACLLQSGFAEAGDGVAEISTPDAPAPTPVSLRRFGDYELLGEIARGGMGVVYRARQVRLDRIVAVKMIRSAWLPGADEVERFLREARAAAQLQHPHIVAIHEVGEHEGQPYFSMDYVAGANLGRLVRERPFIPTRAASITRKIAEAIQHAHQHGVLHRDLKPSNVLLDLDDEPRVTDFGLARLGPESSELTTEGAAMGSPQYMPPEQARGRLAEIDARSDVYSLGALLYELITGRPPFQAATPLETLKLVTESEPVAPRLLNRSLPRDLETICLKCLNKERERRYTTARELAEDLGRFLSDEPIHARPAGSAERLWRWCRRQPALAASFAATAALLSAVALISTTAAFRLDRANDATRHAQSATTEKLIESYAEQARGLRTSGRPGQRFEALDAVRQALALQPSPELRERLRREAVLAFCLPDFQPAETWLPPGTNGFRAALSPDLQFTATADRDGNVALYRNAGFSRQQRAPHTSLPAEAGVPIAELPSAGRPVALLRFSADSSLIALMDDSANVRVWHPGRGDIVVTARADHMEFSPDGRWFAGTGGGRVGEVQAWNLADGQSEPGLLAPGFVAQPRFSPDGRALAVSATQSNVLWIFSWPERNLISTLTLSNRVEQFQWHPDSRRLVLAEKGSPRVQLWDAPANRRLWSASQLIGGLSTLAINHAGTIIATTGGGVLSLRAVADGAALLTRASDINEGLEFTRDDTHLVGGTGWDTRWPAWTPFKLYRFANGASRVLRAEEGTAALRVDECAGADALQLLTGVRGVTLVQSPWGHELVTLPFAEANAAFVVSPPARNADFSRQQRATGEALPAEAGVPPTSGTPASAGSGPERRGDAGTRERAPIRTVPPVETGVPPKPGTPASAGSGSHLYLQAEGQLWRWAVSTLADHGGWGLAPGQRLPLVGARPLRARSFTRDGSKFIALRDRQAIVFDAATMQPLARTPRLDGVRFASLSPDGARFATGSERTNGATIWNARDGALERVVAEDLFGVDGVFSPDGRWFAVNGWGRAAQRSETRFYNTTTWRATNAAVTGPASHNRPMAFSPDSRWLAHEFDFNQVRLLEVGSGRVLATFESAQRRPVYAVSFSADGTQLFAVFGRNELRTWNLAEIRAQLAELNLDWDSTPNRNADFSRQQQAERGDAGSRADAPGRRAVLPAEAGVPASARLEFAPPDSADSWWLVGRRAHADGRFAEAHAAFDQSLALAGTNAPARSEAKRWRDIIEHLQRVERQQRQ